MVYHFTYSLLYYYIINYDTCVITISYISLIQKSSTLFSNNRVLPHPSCLAMLSIYHAYDDKDTYIVLA